MSAPTQAFGTQIDLGLRNAAEPRAISPDPARNKFQSLQDLLEHLDRSAAMDRHQVAMMHATARHISQHLGLRIECVELDQLPNTSERFKQYLKERHFKRNAVRSYGNYLRLMIKTTEALGWSKSPEILEEWKPILDVARKKGCGRVVRDAANLGKRPADFGDTDLEEWAATTLGTGRSYNHVTIVKHLFRHAVHDSGLSHLMPHLSRTQSRTYAIPILRFPEPLRGEIEEMIRWKQALFVPGAAGRTRLRDVSANNLRRIIGRLYGFAVRRGKYPQTLDELIEQDLVTAFALWCINERKLKTTPLRASLGSIYAAVTQYRRQELTWFSALLQGFPKEPSSGIRERKSRKWVSYEVLAGIPKKINAAAAQGRICGKRLAMMKRDELLMMFITVLPWRQRNLRECKLGSKGEGANLFKDEIAPFATFAKPVWVQEALQRTSHDKFWQFHFREHETKTGQEIHSLLPRQLVLPLEDYLQRYRPLLVTGSDPGTLFVTSRGRPVSINQMARTVGEITLRYAGRRVTPHLCRDIFAVGFLEDNHKEYLTLSKILWHRNPKTTICTYASNFDESHGALATEEWIERRTRRSAQVENAGSMTQGGGTTIEGARPHPFK